MCAFPWVVFTDQKQSEFKQIQNDLVELKKFKYEHSEREKRLATQVEELRSVNVNKAKVYFRFVTNKFICVCTYVLYLSL